MVGEGLGVETVEGLVGLVEVEVLVGMVVVDSTLYFVDSCSSRLL